MAIKKVTVLYGGESSERSVSLESGKYVFQSVKNLGYEAELIDYPSEFSPEKFLQEDAPGLVKQGMNMGIMGIFSKLFGQVGNLLSPRQIKRSDTQ